MSKQFLITGHLRYLPTSDRPRCKRCLPTQGRFFGFREEVSTIGVRRGWLRGICTFMDFENALLTVLSLNIKLL